MHAVDYVATWSYVLCAIIYIYYNSAQLYISAQLLILAQEIMYTYMKYFYMVHVH